MTADSRTDRGGPVPADSSSGSGSATTGDGAEPSQPATTSACAEAPGRGRATWRVVRYPVTRYLAVAAGLYLLSWLSIEFGNRHPSYPRSPVSFRGAALLEGWVRWDGNWYEMIATQGYSYNPGRQSSVAFFPAYPTAMRLVNLVLRDAPLAGILVTFVAGLGVAVLFHRWCATRVSPATANRALLVLLLYPYAYYLFGAVYADAVFVLAALAAFLLVEHDHPILAGVAGLVATAARPVGVAVIVGLVAVLLERRGALRFPALERWRARRTAVPVGAAVGTPTASRVTAVSAYGDPVDPQGGTDPPAGRQVLGMSWSGGRLRPADAGVLLSVTGLAAWCTYLWRTYGDPFLFATVEGAPGWDQAAGPSTWFKLPFFDNWTHLPQWWHDAIWRIDVRNYSPWSQTVYTLGTSLQALLVIGALVLVPAVVRRIGWGYGVYVLCVVGVPLIGSKDFQGTGRYMLAAFPCFLVVAQMLGDRPRLRTAWFVVSGVLLVVWTSLFARGYYVA